MQLTRERIITAAVELIESEGVEAQEFRRTASRLIEMRSQSYLALPHGRRNTVAGTSIEGIIET